MVDDYSKENIEKLKQFIAEKRNERQRQIEILRETCKKNDISLDNLKTHIEIYSEDMTGQKLLVHKRDYSMEDVATGHTNDQFFIKLRDIVQKELHLPYDKVVHLMYPDYFDDTKSGPKKLIIAIENSIEK